MKPRASTLATLILIAWFTGPASADKAAEPDLMDKAKQSAGEAAEWTKEKAQQGWNATKEGAGKAADWTADKAEKGADAAAKGINQAADWTGEKAKKGGEWGKEKSQTLWEKTKAFFTGGDSKEGE